MKAQAFDGISRDLEQISTRRSITRLLGGVAALGAAVVAGRGEADAKKKRHKKKKRKAQPLIVPPPVTTPVPPARKVGTCSALRNRCTVVDPAIALCDPVNDFSACLVTTSGELFCATLFGFEQSVNCQSCNQDADCLALGFPPGSACVQLGGKFCNGCEATNNRACFPTAIPD